MLDGGERHAVLQQQRDQDGGRLDVHLDRRPGLADGIDENLGRFAGRKVPEPSPVLLSIELEIADLMLAASRQAVARTDDGDKGHDAPPDLEVGAALPYLLDVIEASIMFLP